MRDMLQELPAASGKMVVQAGRKIYFIDIDTISYVEACNYYILIHTGDKTFVVREALKDLEKKLCPRTFIRVHRSIILNINIFKCIEKAKNTLMVRTTIGKDFKVSRYRNRSLRTKILTHYTEPLSAVA
ncbi:LytTR family DNA-binding domain-containing protein [Chryseolinea lacunae]|uniref:LytTR family transcriptional regulator n=1 Tax=Chryseolinea lacunae TaxID=2801331 RepID=A0ABS1KRD1_9BACT|nr:LytTR family DNA-binding domain-containing protein [Chryseolinea lacunae]MBL0740841.1 LytTR family transcriptional regulator [Chryseolinea lacunae]